MAGRVVIKLSGAQIHRVSVIAGRENILGVHNRAAGILIKDIRGVIDDEPGGRIAARDRNKIPGDGACVLNIQPESVRWSTRD